MAVFRPDWSRFHQDESSGLLSPLLAFFSVLYGQGIGLRLLAYNRGLFKRKSLPGFVVSIGNLTAGGTGKTPAAVMLAKWASEKGYCVAVLSRGYKGRYKNKVLEVSDGTRIHADPGVTGDEPYLLAKKLSGIPVIISKTRYLAGLFAHGKFGSDFFILDDGFQHLDLKRDLDLTLIDASRPFGNGHLLPWGPLREPVDQLTRADAFILTRACQYGSNGRAVNFLNRRFPTTPVFYGDHIPEKVVFPHSNKVCDAGILKGKRILAFAGIARPESFKDTLIRLGADAVYLKGFRDHHRFNREEIQALIRRKEKINADCLLTTEKDWVRMSSFHPVPPDMGYLCIRFSLVSGESEFFEMVNSALSNYRRVIRK
jgi:tetraacyldisaccharide 4'-kinase